MVRASEIAMAATLVTACGPSHQESTVTRPSSALPPAEPSLASQFVPRVVRAAPAPFLNVPGLTMVEVLTHANDEFGGSSWTHVEVLRAGGVVCKLTTGSSSAHEGHGHTMGATIVTRTRSPLRFDARALSSDREFGSSSSCTGYELADAGACRLLFSRSCPANDCKGTATISVRPGTGKITGTIVHDGEPAPAATLIAASAVAIADTRGAFELVAGGGTHELRVYFGNQEYALPNRVTLRTDEDATVAITATCACCATP